MAKNKILIALLTLTNLSVFPNNSTGETIPDLEFYSVINNCVQQYMSCKNTVATSNPDLDCLQWGKCQHLSTLDALMQLPYIRNTLANNSQLNSTVSNTLTKYGKDKLAKQLNNYSNANITSLLTDLTSELNNSDQTTLSNAGITFNSLNGLNQ